MLSVRLLVKKRLLVVNFGGSQKLSVDFELLVCEVSVPIPTLFKSQLYFKRKGYLKEGRGGLKNYKINIKER